MLVADRRAAIGAEGAVTLLRWSAAASACLSNTTVFILKPAHTTAGAPVCAAAVLAVAPAHLHRLGVREEVNRAAGAAAV